MKWKLGELSYTMQGGITAKAKIEKAGGTVA